MTGAEFDRVRSKVKAKYGVMVTMVMMMNKVRGLLPLGGDSDTAFIMTLAE